MLGFVILLTFVRFMADPAPALPRAPVVRRRRRVPFKIRLKRLAADLALEGIGTLIAIGLIGLTDRLVQAWIGKDTKFFDLIPVQWVFDAAHVVIVIRLVVGVIKKFSED